MSNRAVIIKASVNLNELVNLLTVMPTLMDSRPVVEFDCARFKCDTIEEVWSLAQEFVKAQNSMPYEKLKEFAP